MLLKAFAWGIDTYFKVTFSKNAPPAKIEVVASLHDRKLESFVYPAHGEIENSPVIALFYGGGWLHGNAWQLAGFARDLSKRGYTVYLPQYRVAVWDEASATQGLSDVAIFWEWFKDRYPERPLYLGGQSAGGFLAAHVALTSDIKPRALLLLNPAAGLDTKKIKRSWPILGQPRGYKPEDLISLDPIHHVKPGMPPTFIAHGTMDVVVPIEWVRRFSTAIGEVGICEMMELKGYGHGFANPHLFPDACNTVLDRMTEFIRRH